MAPTERATAPAASTEQNFFPRGRLLATRDEIQPALGASPQADNPSAGPLPPGYRLRSVCGVFQYVAGEFHSIIFPTAQEAICRAWHHRWMRTNAPADRTRYLDARKRWGDFAIAEALRDQVYAASVAARP